MAEKRDPIEAWGLIGTVAGEIYRAFIDSQGYLTWKEASFRIKRDETIIKLALGWLCREGNVNIIQDGDKFSFKILRPEDRL